MSAEVMSTAPTTAASAPGAPGVPPLGLPRLTGGPLVVVGDEVPAWARRWCDSSARPVRRCRVPGRPAEPASPGRVSAIADITSRAVRDGSMVMVLPLVQPVRGAPPRVVAAVRRFPDDALAVSEAAACAESMGGDLVVAHGLPASFGERSIDLDDTVRFAGRLLETAIRTAESTSPGLLVRPWLARVLPHELVGEQLDADLLVLGGPRTDRWERLGLVARSALFHAPCPVLLTPRLARATPSWWPATRDEASNVMRPVGDRP